MQRGAFGCVLSFIEIPPLSTEISQYAERRTDGRAADPKTYCLCRGFFDGGGNKEWLEMRLEVERSENMHEHGVATLDGDGQLLT